MNNSLSETIRHDLNILRHIKPINEDITNPETGNDAVPYTSNDELLASITQACKSNFGADFSNNKTPMVYYPNEEDIVVTGTIPTLDNATFKFSFNGKKGKGCEITANPIVLNDEKLSTINKIYGSYKNWIQEIKDSDDRKPMSLRGKDETSPAPEPQNNALQPGDDAELAQNQ